jgi:hypothetical protein
LRVEAARRRAGGLAGRAATLSVHAANARAAAVAAGAAIEGIAVRIETGVTAAYKWRSARAVIAHAAGLPHGTVGRRLEFRVRTATRCKARGKAQVEAHGLPECIRRTNCRRAVRRCGIQL